MDVVGRSGTGFLTQLLTQGCLMDHTLVNLVAAAATAELLHAMSETFSARGKVKRLDAYIRNAPYKEMAVNVDTPLKVAGVGVTAFAVLFGLSYLLVSLLDLHGDTAPSYVLAVVLVTYLGSFLGFNKFHGEIGAVTRQFKSKAAVPTADRP
jgi:hypothetical protein